MLRNHNIRRFISMKNIDILFSELAQYTILLNETSAIVESLKDDIKAYMQAAGKDEIVGNEHKASYKEVTSSRLDSKALKASYPDIVAAYTKQITTKRFVFK